uniref:Uncharacterized protein n=1 Tax=Lotharella globosa TaxID=91324 RepID=A0A7S3ZD79_9EUKA
MPAPRPSKVSRKQEMSRPRFEQYYVTQEDNETAKKIGMRLGLNPSDIVNINKYKYEGISLHAKLMKGTTVVVRVVTPNLDGTQWVDFSTGTPIPPHHQCPPPPPPYTQNLRAGVACLEVKMPTMRPQTTNLGTTPVNQLNSQHQLRQQQQLGRQQQLMRQQIMQQQLINQQRMQQPQQMQLQHHQRALQQTMQQQMMQQQLMRQQMMQQQMMQQRLIHQQQMQAQRHNKGQSAITQNYSTTRHKMDSAARSTQSNLGNQSQANLGVHWTNGAHQLPNQAQQPSNQQLLLQMQARVQQMIATQRSQKAGPSNDSSSLSSSSSKPPAATLQSRSQANNRITSNNATANTAMNNANQSTHQQQLAGLASQVQFSQAKVPISATTNSILTASALPSSHTATSSTVMNPNSSVHRTQTAKGTSVPAQPTYAGNLKPNTGLGTASSNGFLSQTNRPQHAPLGDNSTPLDQSMLSKVAKALLEVIQSARASTTFYIIDEFETDPPLEKVTLPEGFHPFSDVDNTSKSLENLGLSRLGEAAKEVGLRAQDLLAIDSKEKADKICDGDPDDSHHLLSVVYTLQSIERKHKANLKRESRSSGPRPDLALKWGLAPGTCVKDTSDGSLGVVKHVESGRLVVAFTGLPVPLRKYSKADATNRLVPT